MNDRDAESSRMNEYGFAIKNISFEDILSRCPLLSINDLYAPNDSIRNKSKHYTGVNDMNDKEKKVLVSNRGKILRYCNKVLSQNGYSRSRETALSKVSWIKYTSHDIKHSIGIRNRDNLIEINLFYTIIIDINVLKSICDIRFHKEIDELAFIIEGLNEWQSEILDDFTYVRVIPCDDTIDLQEIKESISEFFNKLAFPISGRLSTIEDVYNCYISFNKSYYVWGRLTHSDLNLAYFYIKYGDHVKAMELIEEEYSSTIERIKDTKEMYERLPSRCFSEEEKIERITFLRKMQRLFEILLLNLFSRINNLPID